MEVLSEKACKGSSVHLIWSRDSALPMTASSGERAEEKSLTHVFRYLAAPNQDRRPFTVIGGSAQTKGLILCGEGPIVPCDHNQPSTVVDLGQMTVFFAERRRSLSWNLCSTRFHVQRSSDSVCPANEQIVMYSTNTTLLNHVAQHSRHEFI